MRFRYFIFVVIAAVASSLLAWTWAAAQATSITPIPSRVMTGDEIGFRVTGLRGDTPIGQMVIRVNGAWVAVDFNAGSLRHLPVR